ncbi:MAG: hypothetical protein F4Z29_05445, partial [Gemmatimonadetes bacterium]|nr:hypothetical protein [Gemmatimonadota bacterium]
MEKLVSAFLDHLEIERNYSRHTRSAYAGDLGQFQSFLSEDGGGDTPDPESVDKSVVRAFLHHLHREGFSRRTIARRFAAVRSFFH